MRKLLLVLAIAGLAGPASAQSVRTGIEAWQKGDTAGAVAIWRPLAEKGDADAAFNLGQAYRLGRGVPIDLAQAQGWLERAARKGHLDAQTTLGLLLFQNGNRIAAMRWLKAAAEAGESRALLIVGTALYNGDGVDRDPVKAYAYVSRAAAQGLAPAKATLADMDSLMPLDQRQKGVALAQELASRKGTEAASASPKAAQPKAASAKPPATKPAIPAAADPGSKAAAPPSTATSGKWRIQLGAFSQRNSAERLYAKLSGKLGG
ncbi:MAG TPA: SPOR domain-containing protein, partial [Rhizorhapis sp.]|nr:SPOR domain-containing protein [Rhizorhapis sp.]